MSISVSTISSGFMLTGMGDGGGQSNMASAVRLRRLALGLTQRQLAELAEISQASVSDIERGQVQLPTAAVRRRLAAALRLRHIDLLIASGEITKEEVPEAGAPPTVGDEFAAKAERLPPADRQALMQVLDRMLGETTRFSRRAVVAPGPSPDLS